MTTTATPGQPGMLDVQAVAVELGVSEVVVRHLITARKIKFLRVGKKLIRFKREWIDAYMNGEKA